MQNEEDDEPLFNAPAARTGGHSKPAVPAVVRAAAPSARTPAKSLPLAVVRPQGVDPFQEAAEPRLPPGADPEDKLKSFRLIIQQKDEALARGRALFAAVDQEAQKLREVATQLSADLRNRPAESANSSEHAEQLRHLSALLERDTIRADQAEEKLETFVARLANGERERVDLTNALSEVEAQHRELLTRLEDERRTREQLTDELIAVKEAFGQAQAKLRELSGTSDDSNERVAELERQNEQLTTSLAQAEEARQNLVEALDATTEQLNQTTTRLSTVESETEWSKGTLEQAHARIAELEQSAANSQRSWRETETNLAQLETQLEATLAEAKRDKHAQAQVLEQLQLEKDNVQRLEVSLRAHEEDIVSLTDQLHAAQKEVLHLGEFESKLEEAQVALEHAQVRVTHLEGKQSDGAALQEQLDSLHAENEQLRLTLSDAETRLLEQQGSLEASSQAVEQTETRNLQLERELAALESQRFAQQEGKQQRIESLEKQAQQALTRAASVESKLAALEDALATAKESANRAETRAKEAVEKFKTVDAKSRQQESRAVLAESRAKEALARAAASATLESRAKIAETRVAELAAKLGNVTSTLNENEASLLSLQAQEVELKGALEAYRSSSSIHAPPAEDELTQFKQENANLKKKLGMAENAIEAAASLKAKVARLEAQLKLK